MINFRSAAKFDQPATIITFSDEQVKAKDFSISNKNVLDLIKDTVLSGQFNGENGQIFPLIFQKKVILLVGTGVQKDFSLTALRIALKKALMSAYLKKIKSIELVISDKNDDKIKAAIDAILLGTYVWDKYVKQSEKKKDDKSKTYYIAAEKKKIYEDQVAICHGTNLARDLVNDNADTVTSDYFEKTVRGLIKGNKNVKLELLNRKELKAKGLGLHIAVNQGSDKEPKLIIVKYTGANPKEGYTALVGKGMTYDTGGLNIKPTGSMETMRTDMSGAAAVTGTLKNVLDLKLKKNVLFVLTVAENAIGPGAYKPGDVITGYAGKSVEIGNTDAEGRLVLADAISYIKKNYKPQRIIDIATLTGACVVALGHDYSGLVSTDNELSRQLIKSSHETDDRIWRLPSYPELKESVKSQIADIRNIGFPRGAGGAITAAEFLRQFVNGSGISWAHLDIAGTAFVDNSCRMYFGHGGTGAGVRLLTNFLANN